MSNQDRLHEFVPVGTALGSCAYCGEVIEHSVHDVGARAPLARGAVHAAIVPASVIEWMRDEVRKLPLEQHPNSDTYVVVGKVTLGELRAFLATLPPSPPSPAPTETK